MKFKIDFPINHRGGLSAFRPVALFGSCFAENQAQAFADGGFPVLSNPFGIIYNPYSLLQNLRQLDPDFTFSEDQLWNTEGRYFHPDHHGNIEFDSAGDAIEQLNSIRSKAQDMLDQAHFVVITLGTALVFEHENGKLVGNCHRIPSSAFERRLIELPEVIEALKSIHTLLKQRIPNASIVYTISPVRHLRSGIQANSLSKAVLRTAIHEAGLEEYYFPAFEIFMDELRDYRFSQADLAHPNSQAQDYIWQRFVECHASEDLRTIIQEVRSYHQLAAHIPIRDTETHRDKVEKLRTELLDRYPDLTLD